MRAISGENLADQFWRDCEHRPNWLSPGSQAHLRPELLAFWVSKGHLWQRHGGQWAPNGEGNVGFVFCHGSITKTEIKAILHRFGWWWCPF